ncbi:MAG: ATP-binding protein [Bacteriovoracia bacterium]
MLRLKTRCHSGFLVSLWVAFLFLNPEGFAKTSIIPTNWEFKLTPNEAIRPTYQPTDWKKTLPLLKREYQGYIEYRVNFQLAALPSEEIGIYLGQIGDVDRTYVNGRLVGKTGQFPPRYQQYIDSHRVYLLPLDVLKIGVNELRVVTYVEYISIKGLNPRKVVIDSYDALSTRKYFDDHFWYALKVFFPFLCILLTLLTMPWLSNKSQIGQNLLLTAAAFCYFIFGIGKSRVLFHFGHENQLLAYKFTAVSALLGLVFIFIYVLDFARIRRAWSFIFGGGIPIGFALVIIDERTLLSASIAVKYWVIASVPLLFIISVLVLIRGKGQPLWIRLALLSLPIVSLNDVLIAANVMRGTTFMDLGFSSFILLMAIAQFVSIKKEWFELNHRSLQLQWAGKFIGIAKQAGHDIKGPLSAVKLSIEKLLGLEMNKEMRAEIEVVDGGIKRIEGAASKMLHEYDSQFKNAQVKEGPRLTLLDKAILDVVAETKATAPVHIQFVLKGFEKSPSIWSVIHIPEIQSAFSNILRNSVDALAVQGNKKPAAVEIEMKTEKKKVAFEIRDTGSGIPATVIAKVFDHGFSFGKESGSGLGLAQAKKAVETNDGEIAIGSAEGIGTTLTITLPREQNPKWLASQIDLRLSKRVLFIDDDVSVLELWRERVKDISDIKASFHKTPSEIVGKDTVESIVVIDEHFRVNNESGLDWIKKHSKTAITYLCTSAYDDVAIQGQAKNLGFFIIPKPIIEKVALLS